MRFGGNSALNFFFAILFDIGVGLSNIHANALKQIDEKLPHWLQPIAIRHLPLCGAGKSTAEKRGRKAVA